MGILSTNKKIINLGQGYSAGNGISIDDYVISYTGNEGQLYNAGPNIDIYDDQDQLYISGKDWSADIANASSNAYEQATALIPPEFDPSYISGVVDNKLDTTAFSTVSGDYATTSYVDMSDDLTYSRATAWGNQNLAPLNSVADNSAKWNEIEVYEQNSGTYLTAHQDISNKLDTTAFSTVSGTFLTAHQVIPSAKWEYASDVVQSNSAQWSENTGDEEVNNAVYNNSANWNDITVYQTNSASYLTAHQDISNKLDTTAFSTVSGTFLTAHQDLSNYATTGDLNTASGILSGAIDYLSGNAGKTYTGISPIVVNNDTNEISADSQDIVFGSGLDFTNGVLTVTAGGGGTTYTGDAQGALDEVYANSGVWLTAHQSISANEWNSVYDTVESNSGSWTNDYVPLSATNVAIGSGNKSDNGVTFAQGAMNSAQDGVSFAQGQYNLVYQGGGFAQGAGNSATNGGAFSQGYSNSASVNSIAQGAGNNAYNDSLAQGYFNYANTLAFAQGMGNSAYSLSIAQGNYNYASGYSQAFGLNNKITNSGMVIGTYNKTSSDVSFVIGNGSANSARSDSFIIYHNGSVSAMGKISANGVELGDGSTITYDYTGDLISSIDTSGLYSTSAGTANNTKHILANGTMGDTITYDDSWNRMVLNPSTTPFGTTTGIYGPLQYATGAVITYGSSGTGDAQYFGGFLKGNEWFVSNATANQALRGETHKSRGVHISGATTAGTSFDLSINCVSGKSNTANNYNWKLERGGVSGKSVSGEWYYGPAEDTKLRSLSAQYDELKTSYDALSSLFATYSGQWLLPNQGE